MNLKSKFYLKVINSLGKILMEKAPGTWENPMVITPSNVLLETHLLAIQDSAKYIMERMQDSISFHTDLDLLSFAFTKRQNLKGLLLEFGVYKGTTIQHIAKMSNDEIFGFDSFEGLREDWGGNWITKKHFDLGGVEPTVDKNVKLVKGWIQDTLPPFLELNNKSISFMHIDTDTYESSAYILAKLKNRIVEGTVIVFNEYFGYRGWREGEFKAFQQYCNQEHINYKYLGFSKEAVAMIIIA
jgi:hypothetical protein